jgi:hypothetical protein
MIPTSNQDGHQAKIEKRGAEIKKKSSPLKLLGRRAELPDTFLEEYHPMTISSKFSSYEQMVSDNKIFMGISHWVLC